MAHNIPYNAPVLTLDKKGAPVAPAAPPQGAPLLPGESPPDGENRPYTQPVTWAAWQTAFGSRPYETPYQELVENYYYPTFQQIWKRWEGLPEQAQIPKVYNTPTLLADRDSYRREQYKDVDLSYLDDPRYKKMAAHEDIVQISNLITRLQQKLDYEIENIIVTEGTPSEGYKAVELQKELTTTQIGRLSMQIAELMKRRAAFQGRAGEIKEEQHTAEGILGAALDSWLSKSNYKDRDGYSFDSIKQRAKKELPSPNQTDPQLTGKQIMEIAIEGEILKNE